MNPTSPENYFFTQGVLGVTLVALAIVFFWYYKTSQAQIKDLNKIIFQCQLDRLNDSKDTTKEVTGVLQENSQNMRVLSEKIEVGKTNGRDNR